MVASLLYIFPFPSLFSTAQDAAHPYNEPHAVELLVLLSFLFLLNVVRTAADHFLYAGIIAEILLGTIYGTPLAGIVPSDWESTFTALGYLGLVGIVFEGGLSTDLSLLVSNLPLSIVCALTGIGLPVGFSFALLQAGYGYTPLETFAAGAALSSTSLGTTLMALNSVTKGAQGGSFDSIEKQPQERPEQVDTSFVPSQRDGMSTRSAEAGNLQKSRIGTVLISAAVIDDVIGLVLSSLIPALAKINSGNSQTSLSWTIIRPILSSVLIALVTPPAARFILRPLFRYRNLGNRWCTPRSASQPWGSAKVLTILSPRKSGGEERHNGWGTQDHADAVALVLMVLFVSGFSSIAYYTGSSVLFGAYVAGLTIAYLSQPSASVGGNNGHCTINRLSFEQSYARTVGPLQSHLLAPLFFASIGYAIPFLSLWKPVLLWRGLLYALLMAIAKLACGFPIILWSIWPGRTARPRFAVYNQDTAPTNISLRSIDPPDHTQPTDNSQEGDLSARFRASLVPAAFMGLAMVARGEIGLLIAQIARGGGGASSDANSTESLLRDEAFVVCIWAILLCTLVSPITVGYLVSRRRVSITQGIWQ